MLPSVILGAVWTFNMFNVVFLVSGGEPDGATDILPLHLDSAKARNFLDGIPPDRRRELQGVLESREPSSGFFLADIEIASALGAVNFTMTGTRMPDEHGRTARLVGDVPIYDIVIGNGEGEVPLAKLERHLTKLPANITVKQMDSLESKLVALGSKLGPAGLPKGPMPTQAKMRGVQRTVRRK